jgi:hypothetical protein
MSDNLANHYQCKQHLAPEKNQSDIQRFNVLQWLQLLSVKNVQCDPKMNLKYQIRTFNGHIIEPFLRIHWPRN